MKWFKKKTGTLEKTSQEKNQIVKKEVIMH